MIGLGIGGSVPIVTPVTAALGLSPKYIPSNPYVSYATFSTTNAAGAAVNFAPTTDTEVWGTNLSWMETGRSAGIKVDHGLS